LFVLAVQRAGGFIQQDISRIVEIIEDGTRKE